MTTTVSQGSIYDILRKSDRQRISDGEIAPVLPGAIAQRTLVLVWPQLGDFDSLEYAWWIQRERDRLAELDIDVRAVGIGDRQSGEVFCNFTGFPTDRLWMDSTGALHRELGLYEGLTTNWPVLSSSQQAWLNLMLMCAGIASPGTLAEVLRGYTGDRKAPQLIGDEDTIEMRTRKAIARSLSDGVPKMSDVAKGLGMSARSFHRRLSEHGLTFQTVTEDTRRSLAEELLKDGRHSLSDVAFLTGFSEQSSFTRAFKRSEERRVGKECRSRWSPYH